MLTNDGLVIYGTHMKYRMVNSNVLLRPLVDNKEELIIVEKAPTALIRGKIEEFGREIYGKVGRGYIIWVDPQYARAFPVGDETWYITTYSNILAIEEE